MITLHQVTIGLLGYIDVVLVTGMHSKMIGNINQEEQRLNHQGIYPAYWYVLPFLGKSRQGILWGTDANMPQQCIAYWHVYSCLEIWFLQMSKPGWLFTEGCWSNRFYEATVLVYPALRMYITTWQETSTVCDHHCPTAETKQAELQFTVAANQTTKPIVHTAGQASCIHWAIFQALDS